MSYRQEIVGDTIYWRTLYYKYFVTCVGLRVYVTEVIMHILKYA